MKVTDVKAFIYADDIMIWGEKVKGLDIRLAHWERERENFGLRINLEEDSNGKAAAKKGRSGSEIKQVERFTYPGSVEENNGEIKSKINERIRKASQFYHLIKSILWNKDKV
jgi:hypothetical protein